MVSAKDIARGLSIFEIDESLGAIVEAAETEAEANNREISEAVKAELATYAEAFGHKVDRIADHLKAEGGSGDRPAGGRSVSTSVQSRGGPERRLKQMLVWSC